MPSWSASAHLAPGAGVLLTLAVAPPCACTFPDVGYAASGGAPGTTSSSGGGGVASSNSSTVSNITTASSSSSSSSAVSSSSSGCASPVPADCTCPSSCTLPNASASCSGTTCAIDACDSNYADCNHDRADGCEANLRQDDLHCGSCAIACVAPASCKGGKCK